MKKTISIFILLSFITTSYCQKKKLELGFMGGLNVSSFRDYTGNFQLSSLKSYIVGGELGYVLSDVLSIRSNISYEVKGVKTNILPTDDFGNQLNGYTNFNLNYVTLNLLTRGTFGNKIRFYAEGGPYVGYLISAQAVEKLNGSNNVNGVIVTPGKESIKSSYKSTNIGATAGVGAIYPINDKLGFFLSFRRSFGLTSISKGEFLPTFFSSTLKTNSTAIQLGVNFKL
jgi:hypothetical protein